ncbi:MAG: hypothetical protein ACTSRM_05210, partial [Alphaproteobacteria bacterium]
HRKWREQNILACIDDGVSTIPRIVAKLYGAIDAELKGAAALSVLGATDKFSAFYVRAASDAVSSSS